MAAGSANAFSLDNLGGFAQFAVNTPTIARPSTPSMESSDTLITELDPELIVIFKKISKRDTVTKVKALEELENYLTANNHAIKLVLNNWVSKKYLEKFLYR